jgi:hypothetical protein
VRPHDRAHRRSAALAWLAWLALSAWLGGVAGCPRVCEQPDVEIALVGVEADPNVGSFEGPLTWLQTDEQVTLRVTVTPLADAVMRKCDQAVLDVSYELESSDAAIVVRQRARVWVDDTGRVAPSKWVAVLDAAALVAHGKLPDAPGIADREPTATLELEPREAGGWSGSIAVRTEHEELTAALVTLSRSGE